MVDGAVNLTLSLGPPHNNWSGYVEGNGPQSSVTGALTVPNLNTPLVAGSIMSEWVGIDGDGSSDLIQAGIQEYADPSDPPRLLHALCVVGDPSGS
jgi:hypothetical protein